MIFRRLFKNNFPGFFGVAGVCNRFPDWRADACDSHKALLAHVPMLIWGAPVRCSNPKQALLQK
jgi:hypothetical protein